jgi:hypothetical protein
MKTAAQMRTFSSKVSQRKVEDQWKRIQEYIKGQAYLGLTNSVVPGGLLENKNRKRLESLGYVVKQALVEGQPIGAKQSFITIITW